jgi:hypothetical protein
MVSLVVDPDTAKHTYTPVFHRAAETTIDMCQRFQGIRSLWRRRRRRCRLVVVCQICDCRRPRGLCRPQTCICASPETRIECIVMEREKDKHAE